MVRYVLLRPLRPELDGQLDELILYGRRTVEITTIVLLYESLHKYIDLVTHG
jgi:hypothetical protein